MEEIIRDQITGRGKTFHPLNARRVGTQEIREVLDPDLNGDEESEEEEVEDYYDLDKSFEDKEEE